MASNQHRPGQQRPAASAATVGDDIRRCQSKLGHAPTKEEYASWQAEHPEALSLGVIECLCGNWHVARHEAGCPVQVGFQPREQTLDEAEALRRHVSESLITAAKDLGTSYGRPAYAAYVREHGGDLASEADIRRAYESFRVAMAVAGLSPAQPTPVEPGPLVEELVRSAAGAVDGRLTVRKFDPIRHEHLPPGLLVAPNAKAIDRQYPGGWPGAVRAALESDE